MKVKLFFARIKKELEIELPALPRIGDKISLICDEAWLHGVVEDVTWCISDSELSEIFVYVGGSVLRCKKEAHDSE